MVKDPDFISQTAEPMTLAEQTGWFRSRAVDAFNKGAVWNRFSRHPDDLDLLLYEGWKKRPSFDEEGAPRFQFAVNPLLK